MKSKEGLFRKKSLSADAEIELRELRGEFEVIVWTYGKAIATRRTPIADTSELPYPKALIKAALINSIESSQDAGERAAFVAGYLMLADWQDDVARAPYELQAFTWNDPSEMPLLRELASDADAYARTLARVAAEFDALAHELATLGL